MSANSLSDFYSNYHDQIRAKRFDSPFPIRRAVHREMYQTIVDRMQPGWKVLDAGCGEGVLSLMLAEAGCTVTGLDVSKPNVEAANRFAAEAGLPGDRLKYLVGDAAKLPFEDGSFDCVVSNHVLEHLESFEAGAAEVFRVTRKHALIAVPTCLNPGSLSLLGRDNYWKFSLRSPFSLAFGTLRVAHALMSGREGVNEGYAGSADNVHVFRFPWVVRRILERVGFKVLDLEAQSLCIPYWERAYQAVRKKIARNSFPAKYCGLGTLFVLEKP